jgi:hypothetical protein
MPRLNFRLVRPIFSIERSMEAVLDYRNRKISIKNENIREFIKSLPDRQRKAVKKAIPVPSMQKVLTIRQLVNLTCYLPPAGWR